MAEPGLAESGSKTPATAARVTIAGGIGLAWGTMLHSGAYDIVSKGWATTISLLVATVGTTLIAWLFIEPFMRRSLGISDAHGHAPKFLSRPFFVVYAAVLLTALVTEPVIKRLVAEPWFWSPTIGAVLTGSIITLGWAFGARGGHGRILLSGLIAGALAGAVIYAMDRVLERSFLPAGTARSGSLSVEMLQLILAHAALGLAGAAAIVWLDFLPVWLRLLVGLTPLSMLYFGFNWLSPAWEFDLGRITWHNAMSAVARATGWSLAIVILPGASATLDPSRRLH